MMVDLIKVLLLVVGYGLFGAPDDWDKAVSTRLIVEPNGVTVELAYDPVAIYKRPLNEKPYGGFAMGSFVVVDSNTWESIQQQYLAHELNHIWQTRTYGLLVPLTYPTGIWEPHPYVWHNLDMPSPRLLNWPLFRLWLPVSR